MRNKKKWIAIGVACIIVVLLFLTTGIDLSTDAGGALCISFDKWDMIRADKILLYHNGHTYTITDPDTVKGFCMDTLVGDMTDYCCANLDEGWAEIYRGDRLIRRMRYIANHDTFAYEADIGHWVLFGDEGHAELSQETRNQLKAIMDKK